MQSRISFNHILTVFFMIGSMVACGSMQIAVDKVTYPKEESVAELPSDEDLFLLGTSYLGGISGLNPDYFNAKLAFQRLLENYPVSQWRDLSQTFIILIEEIESLKAIQKGIVSPEGRTQAN
jgi:hypothetical protein